MPAAAPPERFELVPLAGGIHSLRSLENRQTFHPVVGPRQEAVTVHLGGTRPLDRVHGTSGTFVLWDVGLGAAANALAAVEALGREGSRGHEVKILSFDHSLAALEFALANADALEYPLLHKETLEKMLAEGMVTLPLPGGAHLHWQLQLADFPGLVDSLTPLPAPQAIFYDPYSPSVNPAMWTLETFVSLLARTHADSPCLLTTYTRSTAVRATLLLAGWHVGVGGATGEKDETTVAANLPGLLDRPLPRSWLEGKVYASTNAAPLRDGKGWTRGPIGEDDFARLRDHPQMV